MMLRISDSPSVESRLQPQGPTWKEKLTKVKAAAAPRRAACSHHARKAVLRELAGYPLVAPAQGGQNVSRVKQAQL